MAKNYYVFEKTSVIKATQEELFEFHTNPENLNVVTPPELKTNIISISENPLEFGSRIKLISKQKGISQKWLVEVAEFEKPDYFMDRQISGPFKVFEHYHIFEKSDSGIVLRDRIRFIPPFGIFGKLGVWFILREMKKMFNYRHEMTKKYFEAK